MRRTRIQLKNGHADFGYGEWTNEAVPLTKLKDYEVYAINTDVYYYPKLYIDLPSNTLSFYRSITSSTGKGMAFPIQTG